jgi:tetratricopeptide (TPR) repeat protein
MEQLTKWGIPLLDLRCFALPKSTSSPETAGLWVIFPVQHGLKVESVQYPYGNIGRLWLPLHATLQPAVTEEELGELCTYHWQVFHPAIGFVGFQEDEVLDWSDLLQLPSRTATNWSKAVPAAPMSPPLRHLSPPPVPPLGFIESTQQEINSMDDDITEEDDSLQSRTIRKARDLAQQAGNHQVVEALNERLREIARKRMSEVSRLSEMLDKDPLKALKHAPPLKDTEDHRGRAKDHGGSRLPPRNINFNLGQLGGGRRASSWGINASQYHELRQKYYRLAAKLREAGEIRKAAYVYAHLLEDFRAAANVLRQGGYYLEAAALYEKKLNSPKAAADCLKEGQYYLKAAKIYEQLKYRVMAGDMYVLVGETASAMACYDEEAESLIHKGNYLAAAELLEERLQAPSRAMQILLQGWKKRKQPEQCLTRYFSKLRKDEWSPLIAELFAECSPPRHSSFLDVLLNLQPEEQTDELQQQFQEVALRAASTSFKQGRSLEHYLKRFITEDQLLPIDLRRLEKAKMAWKKDFYRSFSLNQDSQARIAWLQFIRFFNYTLALGKSADNMVIARADSRGYTELKETAVQPHYAFAFLCNRTGYEESTYHIVAGEQQEVHDYTWKGDTVFPHMHLLQLNLLGRGDKAVGIATGNRIVQLHLKEGECFLNWLWVEGKTISIGSRMPFAAEHIGPNDKIAPRLIRTKGSRFFTCSEGSLFIVEDSQLYISEPLFRNSYVDYDAIDGGKDNVRCLYATTDGVSLYHFDKRSKAFHLHQRIRVEGEVSVARYLSSKTMLIALREGHWFLYGQPEGGAHDQWRRHKKLPLPSESRVVDVLPSYPSRSSFSLLCRDGQVYFYDLREWMTV